MPRKKEKQVIAEVSLQPEEKTCTPEEGKASHSRGEPPAPREDRHPGNKKKQVITEVQGNAPAAAPRRQDAAGNKVVD